MEANLEELKKKVLVNKTIKVTPIKRRKPFLKKGHDGEDIYTGCHKDYGLPYDIKTRSYKNPFFEDGEQELFEKLLNQKEGSLNLYNFKVTEPNFWGNFILKLPKEGTTLNLANPSDALMYRVLLQDPKGAKSNSELSIIEKEYLMVDESEQEEELSELGKKQDEANDFMHQIKKSKKKMLDALRLMGKTVDKDASIEWLKTELYKIINEVSTTKGVIGIDKFLEVMKDPVAETKLFVLDAIEAKELVRTQTGFKVEGLNEFVGLNYNEVVKHFLGSDPKVKELKQIIQSRLN